MSRYRAPQPTASPYVTRAGFERLQAEQGELWVRRRDVVAALSAAAAEGDRSENAEYQYRCIEDRAVIETILAHRRRTCALRVFMLSGYESLAKRRGLSAWAAPSRPTAHLASRLKSPPRHRRAPEGHEYPEGMNTQRA